MVFKTLIILSACVILSTMADDVKHPDDDAPAGDVTPIQDGALAVAEVEHIKQDDLQTGDEDLKSDGSALLHAYAPYGPVGYGHAFAPQVPFPAFYGKPYAYGYHHGYHHGLPFFGYGGFGGYHGGGFGGYHGGGFGGYGFY